MLCGTMGACLPGVLTGLLGAGPRTSGLHRIKA